MSVSTPTPTSTSTITELRAVKTGAPVLVAHYDLPGQNDLFVAHALELNGRGYATDYTINPLRPERVNGLGLPPTVGRAASKDLIVLGVAWAGQLTNVPSIPANAITHTEIRLQ
jgi:hypothetical protein